ncbi:MAG: hypothetical protein QM692_04400 [Thermomicrobiales bacterium]
MANYRLRTGPRRWQRAALTIALALTLLLPALPGAAQAEPSCSGTAPVSDDLASAAMGLTRGELDALYGAGDATQTGWNWAFDGFDLLQSNCNLILTIDPASEYANPANAQELVRLLLPEDAQAAGTWQFGTLQSPPQDAALWISSDLDDRFKAMGEPYLGQILVLATYNGDAYNPGAIIRIEIRAAPIPG